MTPDEELIQRYLAAQGKPMLPYTYGNVPDLPEPPALGGLPGMSTLRDLANAKPPVKQRNMTPEEIAALYSQEQQGIQPDLITGVGDVLMNPVMSFLQDAINPKYLAIAGMAAPVLGMAAMKGRVPKRLVVGEGELTGENVLRAAERLRGGEGTSYGQWIKENPEAGAAMFDLANAERAGVFPEGPLARPAVGPKGVPERTVQAFKNPRAIAKLREWVDAGMQKMPDPWYRTGPLYEAFEKEWGPAQAPAEMQKMLEYIAATSTSAAVPDNLKIASYYNYLAQQGLPIPEKPAPGYGHKYQGSHRDAAIDFREGTFDPIDNPKRGSYVQNLGGNEDALTADRHFWRAVGIASGDPRFLKTRFEKELADGTKIIRNLQQELAEGKITMRQAKKEPQWWDEAPKPAEYGYAESAYKRRVAEPMGLTLGKAQEKQWVGAGDVTGLGSPPEPILRTLARRISYTAYQMGTTPEKVLQAYVQGKIPLLELGAGAAGLSMLPTLSGPPSSGDGKQRERY